MVRSNTSGRSGVNGIERYASIGHINNNIGCRGRNVSVERTRCSVTNASGKGAAPYYRTERPYTIETTTFLT